MEKKKAMRENNIFHTCLQTMLVKRYMTDKEFDALVQQFGLETGNFRGGANEHLDPIGLVIRDVFSDYDNQMFLGICQRDEDSNAKEGLSIPEAAIPVFFKFLDTVISKDDRSEPAISIGDFLDRCEDIPNSTGVKVQEHLAVLMGLGYIEIIDDRLRVGPRGLLEFKPVFSEFGSKDVMPECPICMDYVIAGLKCQYCEGYYHRRCISDIPNKECPHCRREGEFSEFGM
jgi:hypothetical protein